MKEKHIVIQDQIGRTVVGEVVGETPTSLTLKNPVFFHVQVQEGSGQIAVNTYPLFFFEFLHKDFRDVNNWTYQKSNIIVSDVTLDDSIMQKYLAINTPQPVKSNPKVISIDDI